MIGRASKQTSKAWSYARNAEVRKLLPSSPLDIRVEESVPENRKPKSGEMVSTMLNLSLQAGSWDRESWDGQGDKRMGQILLLAFDA